MDAQHAPPLARRRHVGADRRLCRRDRDRLDVGGGVSRRGSRWVRGSAGGERSSLGRARGRSVRAHAQQLSPRGVEPRVGRVPEARDPQRRDAQWRGPHVPGRESHLGIRRGRIHFAGDRAGRPRRRWGARRGGHAPRRSVRGLSQPVECAPRVGASARRRAEHAGHRGGGHRARRVVADAIARDDVGGILPLGERRTTHVRHGQGLDGDDRGALAFGSPQRGARAQQPVVRNR